MLIQCLLAFESIASGQALHIPHTITGKYVKFAEEIVSTSYTQSEKFSSVSYVSIIKYDNMNHS